jgi:hypothetical protein
MPAAPNTTASMILRTTPATPNTSKSYSIYNLGQNQILAGQSVLNGIGDWDFAGPGAVNFDFDFNFGSAQSTVDLWVKRATTIDQFGTPVAVNQFLVYNIRDNAVTSNSGIIGTIGPNWEVQGFGYFFSGDDFGQADMMTLSVTNGTASYLAYDTQNDQFLNFIIAAQVGADWNTAGFGTYVNNAINPPNNFASLMFLQQSGTGTVLAYVFRDGQVKNALGSLPDSTGKIASPFAIVGQQIVGFGRFSSTVPLGMITRDASNTFRIYDVVQNFDATGAPFYTAALSSVNGGTLISSANGVQSTMTLAGFAPISGPLGPAPITNDMVLRDTTTGKFYFYDIKDDALAVSGELPQPPSPSTPIDAAWTVGGIAPDFSATASAGATAQLAQAMAGFGDGSGAADGLNAAPLGADASQQQFLATPQHA